MAQTLVLVVAVFETPFLPMTKKLLKHILVADGAENDALKSNRSNTRKSLVLFQNPESESLLLSTDMEEFVGRGTFNRYFVFYVLI